jgi:lysophospholipase L1-like esterase
MKKILHVLLSLALVILPTLFLSECISIQNGELDKKTDNQDDRWIVTWASAQQATEERNLPPNPGLQYNTLRQIIHTSVGGKQLRFKFSNVFGIAPVAIDSVHMALSTGGRSIDPGTNTALTFQGNTLVGIPPGDEIYSDPVNFNLEPLSDLAVSIYFIEIDDNNITGHPGSRCTSYIKESYAFDEPDLPGAATTDHWYILAGLEVLAADAGATLVIAGDSITDGRGSTTNKHNRWPDALAVRMQNNDDTSEIGIYNAGIGGNAVLRGGLGPTLMQRLERDVLNQSGVRWLIVLEGVNDIGSAKGKDQAQLVQKELIEAYKTIIGTAHKASITVYGATITPFGRSLYDSPEREAARQAVNEWIRTSGAFDAVIDMDRATRDPDNPSRLRPEADSGDHLHLNPAGYQMMADAVDLQLFTE